jgi:hypothetical protein
MALGLAACSLSPADEPAKADEDPQKALRELERLTGAPVSLELSDRGTTRVIAMTGGHPLTGLGSDPAAAAEQLLARHHSAFRLRATDADDFAVTRVDVDPGTALRHVTLQRTYDGVPVFHGGITVHMDAQNGVFRVLCDDAYWIDPPTNQLALSPSEGAEAAGAALGLADLRPSLTSSDDRGASFAEPRALAPIRVEPRVFHAGPKDDRFAYQVVLSWRGADGAAQHELALVDAESGALLARHSLVNDFRGRVFTSTPGVNPQGDTRVLVSFDGDPVASPSGWVDASRRTRGNNAVAATDLDGDDQVAAGEIQPTADANGDFDFPFSGTQDASNFKDASVTSAFFLVNDFHDRTYALGFTESAGNFQTDNFGRGGLGGDEVQVDAQDGSGVNNANFFTPPDGLQPRMQMFLFTFTGGVVEDGDFEPGVVYHEAAHGLSNRLVGGGTAVCLFGVQSGGMGEGWSDFMAATFLDDPVNGAYVTGNAVTGVRRAPIDNSPFTYDNVQDGTMLEVHDGGEIWAATLFDIRKVLGAKTTDQLVVTGMKLTPCNPSMLQARDAIIAADEVLNQGVNRCELFKVFAQRKMGSGAFSFSDDSSNTVVTSADVPVDCGGPPGGEITGQPRTFTANVPVAIPDANVNGVSTAIEVPAGLDVQAVLVDLDVAHTFVGDLQIALIAPNGQLAILANREGGSDRNIEVAGANLSRFFTAGSAASGRWTLFARDLEAGDAGAIVNFRLTIVSSQ